jgi:hypothetical protein
MSRIKIGGNRGTKGRAAASQNRAKQADARAAHLAPIIARLRGSGIASLYGIARALSALAIPTPNGRKNGRDYRSSGCWQVRLRHGKRPSRTAIVRSFVKLPTARNPKSGGRIKPSRGKLALSGAPNEHEAHQASSGG